MRAARAAGEFDAMQNRIVAVTSAGPILKSALEKFANKSRNGVPTVVMLPTMSNGAPIRRCQPLIGSISRATKIAASPRMTQSV
jgi:hypothetical protein